MAHSPSTTDWWAVVIVDNQFLDNDRKEGLFLALDNIVDMEKDRPPEPLHVLSTSKVLRINPTFEGRLPQSLWKSNKRASINEHLTADLFYFRRNVSTAIEGHDQLERNLNRYMPQIVTARFPALTAALANTQIEFDRAYRTLIKEPGYQGKNLAFIAGINIDISPQRMNGDAPSRLFKINVKLFQEIA